MVIAQASYHNGLLVVKTPAILDFVDDLKDTIPVSFRSLDPQEKAWLIELADQVAALRVLRHSYPNARIASPTTYQTFTFGPKSPPADPDRELVHLMPTSPMPVVEGAYRGLAKVNHPDRGGDQGAVQRINAAYERIRSRELLEGAA